jgi:fatty-acyl-CoA synthase
MVLRAPGKLLISSAPARRETKQAIMALFPNGQLFELCGSTEAGWVTVLRPGTVGREWAGSGAIKLLDDQGREVPDGEVGELYSRTAYFFDGYWKNPDKNAEVFWWPEGQGPRGATGKIQHRLLRERTVARGGGA